MEEVCKGLLIQPGELIQYYSQPIRHFQTRRDSYILRQFVKLRLRLGAGEGRGEKPLEMYSATVRPYWNTSSCPPQGQQCHFPIAAVRTAPLGFLFSSYSFCRNSWAYVALWLGTAVRSAEPFLSYPAMGVPLPFLGFNTFYSFPPQNSAWGPKKHLPSDFCLYSLWCNIFPQFLDPVWDTECYLAKCIFSQVT